MSNVAENLSAVVVLVDTHAAAGVTVAQLAAFIAMVGVGKNQRTSIATRAVGELAPR
jgi:hypothetical protein